MNTITVPIFNNFSDRVPIGYLSVDEDKLPPYPAFCFSLGYKVLNDEPKDFISDGTYMGKYELNSVAICFDQAYKRYLDK